MPDYSGKVKFKVQKTIDPFLKQFLPKEEDDEGPVAGRDTMVWVKTKRDLMPGEDIHWSTTLYEVSTLSLDDLDYDLMAHSMVLIVVPPHRSL